MYDPVTGAWSTTNSMGGTHARHTATLLVNGQVVLAGGHESSSLSPHASAELYIPEPVSPPNALHVGDLDASSFFDGQRYWRALVTITVLDNNGIPVINATVSGNWSGGITGNAACTTGGSGTCSVTSSKVRTNNSSVIFTMSNVSHATLAYDAAANRDPDRDSNGTMITVSKP